MMHSGTVDMPDPAPTSMFDNVYAEQVPEVAEQRAEFVAYHAGFDAEGAQH